MQATTTRTRDIRMSDAERLSRHARSMGLYNSAILLAEIGTVFGIVGVALWPMLIAGALMLIASVCVGRRAAAISPYGKNK